MQHTTSTVPPGISGHRTGKRRGFTLIELLIVICIISLLAAILFPVFARARGNARRSACQSNLKQIGLAIQMYTQDNDETLPTAKDDSTTSSKQTSWDKLCEPYLGLKTNSAPGSNTSIFKCPNDTVQRAFSSSNAATRSYSMPDEEKSLFITGPSSGSTNLGRKLASVPDAAGTLLVVESVSRSNIFGDDNGATIVSPDAQLGTNATVGNMHFDGWNYLFVDGHVKWFRPEQTIGKMGALNGKRNGINWYCSTRASQTSSRAEYACGMWSIKEGD